MADEDAALFATLEKHTEAILSNPSPSSPNSLKDLRSIVTVVKSATSSMTSVPVPLKFFCSPKKEDDDENEDDAKEVSLSVSLSLSHICLSCQRNIFSPFISHIIFPIIFPISFHSFISPLSPFHNFFHFHPSAN